MAIPAIQAKNILGMAALITTYVIILLACMISLGFYEINSC